MTMTQLGQDIVGLSSTETEYANAVLQLQKDNAYYNYSVQVVQNKQAWLQLFNGYCQAIITYSAGLAASDTNFQTLQTGLPSDATSQAVQSKFQSSGVAYAELVELPISFIAFNAFDNWAGSTQKWLNDVAADSAGFVRGLGTAGATVLQGARFVTEVPGFAMKTVFAPFKVLGSGVIEVYDAGAQAYGWTPYNEIPSIKWMYDKLGVSPTRAWRCFTPDAVKQGLGEFVDTLYTNNSTLVNDVKGVFSREAPVGVGLQPTDLLPAEAQSSGTAGATTGGNASSESGEPELSAEGEAQARAIQNSEKAVSSAETAVEGAESLLSKFGKFAGAAGGLFVVDTIIGIAEGEVEKGEYQDAINSLNAQIDTTNTAATALSSANDGLNAAVLNLCQEFAETFDALAYLQTPVVPLTVDPSTLPGAAWDAPLDLSDAQIASLAQGTYNDPYNWSMASAPATNPFCTTIQPYAAYYAAAAGAAAQFAQLCAYKTQMINFLNNPMSGGSLTAFWEDALMFSANGGVIGSGASAVNMGDPKNQRWLTNCFAITSDVVANALSQPGNYAWLIADFSGAVATSAGAPAA